MPAWSSFEPPNPFVVRIAGTRAVGVATFGVYRSPTMSQLWSPFGPICTAKCSVWTVYGSSAADASPAPTARTAVASRTGALSRAARRGWDIGPPGEGYLSVTTDDQAPGYAGALSVLFAFVRAAIAVSEPDGCKSAFDSVSRRGRSRARDRTRPR